MTQIEKLLHTKSLIDKLAEGINPLTGQKHDEDCLLNEASIIRGFFHVSQVLDRVIQNGGVVGYGRKQNLNRLLLRLRRERTSLSRKSPSR